jgi:hypothetical protein
METTVREVLTAAGVPFRSGGADWLRIPALWRGSRDYNLAVNRNTGKWILHSTGETGSWSELLTRLGIENGKRASLCRDPAPFRRDSRKAALQLWDEAFPLRYPEEYREPFPALRQWRAAAWAYLENRGIPQASALAYAPDLRVCEDEDAVLLLIPLRAPADGDPLMGVQRIRIDTAGHKTPFLDKEGKPTEDTKRMLGPRKTAAGSTGWWLPEAPKTGSYPERVLLCEGPETAMGLQAFTGRQVWCLADAGGLRNASSAYLERRGIRSVCIAGDHDSNQVGLIAAADLALRLRQEHPDWQITVALPPERDTDWLDVLVRYGPEQSLRLFRKNIEHF